MNSVTNSQVTARTNSFVILYVLFSLGHMCKLLSSSEVTVYATCGHTMQLLIGSLLISVVLLVVNNIFHRVTSAEVL